MDDLKLILDGLSHVIFGVVLFATTVVRLTPTKADDKKLDQILKRVHKFMGYLPTVGKNPVTKELEDKDKDKTEEPKIAGS